MFSTNMIIDEARDDSKKEQMTLVLRFVNKPGLIQEWFFDVAHVKDIVGLTLKELFYQNEGGFLADNIVYVE